MRAITILAIVAIVAALGAVTILVPLQQVSAVGEPERPLTAPNQNAFNGACAGAGAHHTGTPNFWCSK